VILGLWALGFELWAQLTALAALKLAAFPALAASTALTVAFPPTRARDDIAPP